MEKIWAPWRAKYIYLRNAKKCIFCVEKRKTKADREKYILKRNRYAFSMLNRYPYNNGHVMVAPYRHVRSLEFLKKEELTDLMDLVNSTKKKIDRTLKPAGYNIGLNIGKLAGAGFARHVHIHIVPRWKGDTNFMPIIGDVKIVSDSLDKMWELLKE